MKHFLLLAAAAGFLPVLIINPRPVRVAYDRLFTELPDVQKEIVTLHNTFRREVRPTASNMLKMNWSEEVAKNARVVSKDCEGEKSNSLSRRITNTFCGENKHLTTSPISWSNVIKTWHKESQHFKYGQWISAEDSTEIEHYTQLVWATSYEIGCGITQCGKKSSTQYLYVCQYCHEGNDPDKMSEPYNKGAPCQDCPDHCEDNLCTNPCIYYDEHYKCKSYKENIGCNRDSVKFMCKATCLCDTEIK